MDERVSVLMSPTMMASLLEMVHAEKELLEFRYKSSEKANSDLREEIEKLKDEIKSLKHENASLVSTIDMLKWQIEEQNEEGEVENE